MLRGVLDRFLFLIFSGVNYQTRDSAGENIAKVWPYSPDRDFESIPKMMVDGLMDSEGHKDNILNPVYKILSIGVFHDNRPEAEYAIYILTLVSKIKKWR